MPARKQAVPRPRSRYGVEPYPKMVAAALRSVRKRVFQEAFEKVARLTLMAVASKIDAAIGPEAVKAMIRYW